LHRAERSFCVIAAKPVIAGVFHGPGSHEMMQLASRHGVPGCSLQKFAAVVLNLEAWQASNV
jgi:hypothetical protein